MNPPHYIAVFLVFALPGVVWAEGDGIVLFEKQVRPLLVQHCYECHSAKSKELKGGLALDSKAGWVEGGDSGPAITPGEVDDSLLISAVRYEDIEMPPKGKLSVAEIAILEKWVKLGAPDPRDGVAKSPLPLKKIDLEQARQFWSFRPVQAQQAPAVTNRDWPRDEIDRFVLAKLEEKGLAPAADSDSRTWIRRVTYDLTGLPPTTEEVQAFLKDSSEEKFERVVDRLLESPHFGEHWGRHWLDVARYADSNGSDFNATFHNAWRYRNYVVAAMNTDKPFDQFIREQLAGDLLSAESKQQRADQLVATGFLMIGAKMLSERDKKKLIMDVVDEQIDTVGRAFLGMTLGCARCHDHKFDPIPTKDYYALAGIFRSTTTIEGESQQYVSTWKPTSLPVSAEKAAKAKEFEAGKKAQQSLVDQAKQELKSREENLARLKGPSPGIVVDDVAAQLMGTWKPSKLSPNFVGQGYIHDDNQGKGEKSVTFTPDLPKAAQYEVQLSYTPGSSRANNVPVTIKHAEGEAQISLDQRPPPTIEKRFKSLGNFQFAAGKSATVTISNKNTKGHVIVDAVRFVELDEQGIPVKQPVEAVAADLKAAQEKIENAKQQLTAREAELKKFLTTAPPPLPKALAVYENKKIDDCEICIRGVHKNLGPKVPRGFLQVATSEEAPGISVSESGRRELADWIASDEHPLTARVIVNRIWYHLFGEGIVRSVDNFGQLGDRPTHPELLDRLAFDFTQDGWSMKRMVRRIALSRAYAMSSEHREQAWQADPENKLLWRAHRRRLPAEAIRDSLLAISGQLDTSPGQSPVLGLGTLVTNNSANEEAFKRDESQKRSMYLPIIRSQLPAILTVFDFADPDLSTGKRNITNVPAQALLLMNSPFVMDCCRKIAADLLADSKLSGRDRVNRIYEKVLSRVPNEPEVQRMLAYVASRNPSSDRPAAAEAQVKPWAELVQVLFASTEFCLLN